MNSRRRLPFIVVILLFVWAINMRAQQPAGLDAQILQEANFGNTAAVRQLLEAGASIEAKDRFGQTPLMAAAGMGRSETVTFLLDKGANIEAEAGGDTALNLAAQSGNENTAGPVKLLLARGARVEANHGMIGATPLIQAATAHTSNWVKYEKVKLLLDKGAKVDARDIVDETALIGAAGAGATNTVDLLLQRGAAIEHRSSHDGCTALIRAATAGHADTVKLLLAKGANSEVKDNSGRTALMWTVIWGNIETVRVLLYGGANIQTKDNGGDSALDYAIHTHKTAVIQLFQTYRPPR